MVRDSSSQAPWNDRKLDGLRVVALAGGVGGAKLADGLAAVLADHLTVVVNTGDDFDHFGLFISPDLDTVCYTLGRLANPVTGWGRAGETWQVYDAIASLGGPTWFRLGDQDLATHLERTRRLRLGQTLTSITQSFCKNWGVAAHVLPMSDQPAPTLVLTEREDAQGSAMAFQEYFVLHHCEPKVTGFDLSAARTAPPAPGVFSALENCDLVVICPSNPWVSVDPILAIPGVREVLSGKPVIAVSPIIGGQAVKGPAAKMYQELGVTPSAKAVASHYQDLLWGFVLDEQDATQEGEIRNPGIRTLATNTLMLSFDDRRRLAWEILNFFIGNPQVPGLLSE